MNRFDLRPDYDPNLSPQWQGPSEIEKDFVHLVQLIYGKTTNSLLCGSAYKEANEELLNEKTKKFINAANPFTLRYTSPYEPDFCHEDNVSFFSKMKKELIDPFESTDPGQAVSLSWDIDSIARNPYKALLSWQHAYNKYWESYENSSAVIQQQTYYAFHYLSLYLLCLFIPYTHDDATFNPMQILSPLFISFVAEISAFSTLTEVYSRKELISTDEVQDEEKPENAKDNNLSRVMIYDYKMHSKSAWYMPSAFSKSAKGLLRNIFKRHIKKNELPVQKESLEGIINFIVGLCTQYGKAYYLLPFLCTKAFAQLFCKKSSDTKNEDYLMTDSLEDHEVFERLFDSHHRKIQSDTIYNSDENEHPVIAFMMDVISLCYEIEMLDPKKIYDNKTGDVIIEYRRPEYEVMNQVNTNWLILYLYGNKRLFDNPYICSHFCELNLPLLLRFLFSDKSDEKEPDRFILNTSWLFSLARISDKHCLSRKEFDKFTEECMLELEKMAQSESIWNNQLAEYIFNPSIWEDNRLKASSNEFQTQISGINSLIEKARAILKNHPKENYMPSMVVRGICMVYLFDPILEDLYNYLETLTSHQRFWEQFARLQRCLLFTKADIDSSSFSERQGTAAR